MWPAAVGVAVVAVVAVGAGAQVAALVLAGLLVLAAAARWLVRDTPPLELAARAWPVDVAVALTLAAALVGLAWTLPA